MGGGVGVGCVAGGSPGAEEIVGQSRRVPASVAASAQIPRVGVEAETLTHRCSLSRSPLNPESQGSSRERGPSGQPDAARQEKLGRQAGGGGGGAEASLPQLLPGSSGLPEPERCWSSSDTGARVSLGKH